MTPLPIVYVTDMDRSLTFYRALGGTVKSHSPYWTELRFGAAGLALHHADRLPDAQPAQLGLAFEVSERLEQLLSRLEQSGVTPHQPISDEAFGRSALLRDPDGLIIQVNEHDPELYPKPG